MRVRPRRHLAAAARAAPSNNRDNNDWAARTEFVISRTISAYWLGAIVCGRARRATEGLGGRPAGFYKLCCTAPAGLIGADFPRPARRRQAGGGRQTHNELGGGGGASRAFASTFDGVELLRLSAAAAEESRAGQCHMQEIIVGQKLRSESISVVRLVSATGARAHTQRRSGAGRLGSRRCLR